MVVPSSTRGCPRLQDSEVQTWRRQQVYREPINNSGWWNGAGVWRPEKSAGPLAVPSKKRKKRIYRKK